MFLKMDIGVAILKVINTLLFKICVWIYDFVAKCYMLFEKIANAEIIDNSVTQDIFRRVGLILSIYMIFKLTFSAIQALINPDQEHTDGVGRIIGRIVIAIVLLASTGFIFDEARDLQRILLDPDNNIIGKVILGIDSSEQEQVTSNFGSLLSSEIFFAFYTDHEPPYLDDKKSIMQKLQVGEDCYSEVSEDVDEELGQNDPHICINQVKSWTITKLNKTDTGNDVSIDEAGIVLNDTVDDNENSTQFVIEFNGLFAIAAGIFVLYILISYCIAVGYRAIQLAFFQLIAPIPILSSISIKKDTALTKWIQMSITTYIDVFIRVAIIYFVVLMIEILTSTGFNNILVGSTGVAGGAMYYIIRVVLILSLLMFAKKAPDTIYEMFPKAAGSLGFGLSLKEKMTNMLGASVVGGVVGAATAATVSSVLTAAGNIGYHAQKFKENWKTWSTKDKFKHGLKAMASPFTGFGSGAFRGMYHGYKNGVKGGPIGMFQQGAQAATAASTARNQRDPDYGKKYGNFRKAQDWFSRTTAQREGYGFSSQLDSQIALNEQQISNLKEQEKWRRKDFEDTRKAIRTRGTYNPNDASRYIEDAISVAMDSEGNVMEVDGKLQYNFIKRDAAGGLDMGASWTAYQSHVAATGGTGLNWTDFKSIVSNQFDIIHLDEQQAELTKKNNELKSSQPQSK